MKNGTYDVREDAKSLAKLQDRLNTPCVKFGKPAPRFIVLIKKKTRKFPIGDEKNLVNLVSPK